MKITTSLSLALAGSVSVSASALPPRAVCATGVHMIVARASTEAAGQGIIGSVATAIQNAIPGSDSVAVTYPATLQNYQNSESQGVAAMMQLVTSYVASCPTAKIVLLGYSQGAQVVGDSMCGAASSYGFGTGTAGLSADLRKNVIATIQMGDPTHTVGAPQNVGTATQGGTFPRANAATCNPILGPIGQSYCDANDEFCAGGYSLIVHESYVQTYGTAAVNFVVGKMTAASNM